MLEVSNVSKQYATPSGPLSVFADVTFTLKPGEAAAFTGPSGSGKSSLLYALGGLESPSSGTVRLAGRDIFAMNPNELAQFRNSEIGFVFQDHCLLPQCSALENVLVPTLVGSTGGGEKPVDFGGRARALLDQVGLSGRMEHRPSQLSGGEKQRVALARALIREPELMLCDEPTGNLDPASAAVVAELLMDLHRRQKNILVVVTHSAAVAALFPIRFELKEQRLFLL